MRIVLDMGSGNTCKNKKSYVKKMIDQLRKVDTGKHEIILKWQLFKTAGDNIPLKHDVFNYAYHYAIDNGYKCTSSIFDKPSLKYLLLFEIPFVKLACNTNPRIFQNHIPNSLWVYKSNNIGMGVQCNDKKLVMLDCIPKYPATRHEYIKLLDQYTLGEQYFISDHTSDFQIYQMYKPIIYECHYKLADSTGLDSGTFARTPDQLREVL